MSRGLCGQCSMYMANRVSAREAPCVASRFEQDGAFLYREVKYACQTGVKPWCPYRKEKKK